MAAVKPVRRGNSSTNFHLSLAEVLGDEKTEIKSAGPRSVKIIIKSSNRVDTSSKVQKKFVQRGIKFDSKDTRDSSFAATVIKLDDKSTATLIYKPLSDAKVSTDLAESAQAVYGAMAFHLKRNITNTDLIDKNFQSSANKSFTTQSVDVVKTKLNDEWIDSSIRGANELREKYTGEDFEFHKGSAKVKIIENAFNSIKGREGLTINLNKWSPADIYMIAYGFDPNKALSGIKTLASLNAKMYELLKDKKIIGVSLKKIGKTANITNVNFPQDDDTSTFTYEGIASPVGSTSGYIKMKKGNSNMKINLRNFTSSGGWSGEIIVPGGAARHGKISHGPINAVLKIYGLKEIPSNPEARSIASNIKESDAKWMAEAMVNHRFINSGDVGGITNMIMGSNVNYISSKYLVLKLFDVLPLSDKKKMDSLVEDFYRYAGSQIKGVSGPYIKLM